MGTEVYESPSDENLVSFYHEYLIFLLIDSNLFLTKWGTK